MSDLELVVKHYLANPEGEGATERLANVITASAHVLFEGDQKALRSFTAAYVIPSSSVDWSGSFSEVAFGLGKTLAQRGLSLVWFHRLLFFGGEWKLNLSEETRVHLKQMMDSFH